MKAAIIAIIAAVIFGAVSTSAKAGQKAATDGPGTKPFVVYFQGDPSCVIAGTKAKFPLYFQNTGTTPLTFNVTPVGINAPGATYGYGINLAHGTDHLTWSERGPHWLFTLNPGEHITKTLVVMVQPQLGVIGEGEPYSLYEQVLVSPGPLVTPTFGLFASSTPVYCGDPVRTGSMK